MSRVVLMLFVLVVGCSRPAAETAGSGTALQEVELALNWYPEVEHGGFYAAQVHGYFEEAGLKVTILPGGPGAPVAQRVASGGVTFGVDNADGVLLARAQEADVVAVMAALDTSPRCLMVHEESGIRGFDDLKNVTLAMSESSGWAKFVQKTLPLDGVRIVPNPGNVAQFVADRKFAQQAYVFSEPYVAETEGAKVRSLMVSELGYDPYTSLLIVNGRTIRAQPELVAKMVTASVRGWRKYLEDAEPANRAIHRQNPEMGMAILEYGVEAMTPLCITETRPVEQFGTMTAERWETLLAQLVDIGEIKRGAVNPRDAFTARFLDADN